MIKPSENHTVDSVYDDTITLLQEEITRLEGELRLREEASTTPKDRLEDTAQSDAFRIRIEKLTADLGERDTLITLLWDEINGLEQSRAADRAEWEQLAECLDSIERQVAEGSSVSALETQRATEFQERLNAERREWSEQKSKLEGEIFVLRKRLEESATDSSDCSEPHRAYVEEGRRLAALEAAREREELEDRLRDAEDRIRALHGELERARTALEQMRLQHASELVAIRAERSSARMQGPSVEATPDERIRALREHLKEIHARENSERRQRQASNRLSRLWTRLNTPL